jgi:hypothetical protein
VFIPAVAEPWIQHRCQRARYGALGSSTGSGAPDLYVQIVLTQKIPIRRGVRKGPLTIY